MGLQFSRSELKYGPYFTVYGQYRIGTVRRVWKGYGKGLYCTNLGYGNWVSILVNSAAVPYSVTCWHGTDVVSTVWEGLVRYRVAYGYRLPFLVSDEMVKGNVVVLQRMPIPTLRGNPIQHLSIWKSSASSGLHLNTFSASLLLRTA